MDTNATHNGAYPYVSLPTSLAWTNRRALYLLDKLSTKFK